MANMKNLYQEKILHCMTEMIHNFLDDKPLSHTLTRVC